MALGYTPPKKKKGGNPLDTIVENACRTSFTPEILDSNGKAIVRYIFFISSDRDLKRMRHEVKRDYRALSKQRTGLTIKGIEYS